jgi:hypothetical protein
MTIRFTKGDEAGTYATSHNDREIVVRPGHSRTWGVGWIATLADQNQFGKSRLDAVRAVIDAVDMPALDIPELRAMQERWAAEIEAIIAASGGPANAFVQVKLATLHNSLKGFDDLVRSKALFVEKSIRELRQLVPAPKESQSA